MGDVRIPGMMIARECLECGGPLPEGARFCPTCGARIATSAPPAIPAGERRQATILFADLSGYTRLSSTLDPEETHRLLTRFFELADAVIVRWGGAIDKHIGDAVMGVFGAPVAYGNDVERALRAAVDIHAEMDILAKEFARPFATHIGLASGEVVAAATGSAAHKSYTVTGDAVNLAARLTELAQGGETVVSADVQSALAPLAQFEPLGRVAIRGLADGASAYRAVALREPAGESQPLLGREGERSRCAALLAQASTKRIGAVIVIRADPGMGKTRLADALLADSRGSDASCHAATVLDFGIEQGRDAIHALMASLLGIPPDADAANRREALDAALATQRIDIEHEPFIADILLVAQRPGGHYDAMDNDARHRGKFRALAHVLERAAAEHPCVLLIEDIHWASPWVLECAREIAFCTRRLRLLLILTTRRDGDPVDTAWPRESMTVFDLAPLDRRDALALARAHLRSAPDLALRCVERAQGNPLFLVQLLKSDTDESVVPPTIQSVVLARLDRLSARDKAALQAASIIGQRFGLDLLRHLLADNRYTIEAPLERDLVRVDGSRVDQLMFTHALIRDGAYASLLHSTRRDLHRAAAGWYAGRDATLHAEHLDRAEDPAAAGAYLAAARAEIAALRIDAALSLAERGARLDADPPIRQALAMLEGELQRDLGRGNAALAAFERARALASNDAEHCAAWLGIASAHRVTSMIEPGLAALEHAEALATRAGLTRERARIGYLRGNLHFARGDVDACRVSHERALAFARQAGDAECEAQALSGLADALYAQGHLRSAYTMFQRCIEICDREGLTRFALANRCMMAIVDGYLERPAESFAAIEHVRRTAREIQHRYAEVMALETTGLLLVTYGRFGEAKAFLGEALSLAQELGARRFEGLIAYCLARVLWHEGAQDEARRYAQLAWRISDDVGPRFAGPVALGALACTAATEDERARFLADGERLLRQGCVSHCYFGFLRDAMETSLEHGHWADAERYAGELEHYMRDEPLPLFQFQVARVRALAAAGRGDGDRAALEQCRQHAIDIGMPSAIAALDEALLAVKTP